MNHPLHPSHHISTASKIRRLPSLRHDRPARRVRSSDAPELSERVFQRVSHWVAAHIETRINEQDLQSLTPLGPSDFRRAFRARTGLSPLWYVTWTRVDMAIRLLMDTRFSLAEIAFVTGLETEKGLQSAFRDTIGVAPKALRPSAA